MTPPVHPHACGENALRYTSLRQNQRLTVHPHACGENVSAVNLEFAVVRFTPTPVGKTGNLKLRSPADVNRFTPTPVGKTPVVWPGIRSGSVHPHACGENRLLARRPLARRGSPPRLWGKHSVIVALGMRPRFTPTPVGKTQAVKARAAQPCTVHPHACGENALQAYKPDRVDTRFTPTPVGKTRPLCLRFAS